MHDTIRPTGYDSNEHDKGERTRGQISDEEWNDYEWVNTETYENQPPTYFRGQQRT